MVNQRSYAQVLKDGKSLVEQKECSQRPMVETRNKTVQDTACRASSQHSKCVPQKCVPLKLAKYCNGFNKRLDNNHNLMHKGNRNVQESPLETVNRFDILASIADLDGEGYEKVTYENLDQRLRGNKNKTGPTLGQVCHIKNSCVDVSQSLEGNKNKTGYKLDDSTHKLHHDIEHRQQAISQSRGNKNGIRAKLGVIPSHDNHNAVKMTEQTVKTCSQHNQNAKVRQACNADACHELPCMQHTDDDKTCMIYDMVNPAHKRKCNIPDFIHWNKIIQLTTKIAFNRMVGTLVSCL